MGGQERREQAALEQQVVPLKTQEIAADRDVSEVPDGLEGRAQTRACAGQRDQRHGRPDQGSPEQRSVTRHPREQAGKGPKRKRAIGAGCRHEIDERQQSPAAHQHQDLAGQR